MPRLPQQVWDQVFDGTPTRLDLADLGFESLTLLRAACYREAERRGFAITTRKSGRTELVVEVGENWKAGLAMKRAQAVAAQEAADLAAAIAHEAALLEADCTCGGQAPHPPSCRVWG
jgi:hypothetical protein